MINKLSLFLFVLLAAVFQTVLFPEFLLALKSFGLSGIVRMHTLDVVLITLIYLSFQRSLWGAVIWAIVMGMVAGAFGAAWKGSILTSYFMMAILCVAMRNHILAHGYGARFLILFFLTGLEACVQLLCAGVFERQVGMFEGQWGLIFGQMLLNGLLGPWVIALLLKLESVTTDRRRSSQFGVVFGDQGANTLASF